MRDSLRLSLLCLLVLVLATGLFGCDYDNPDHDKVRDAVRAAKDGDHQKAIDIYDELIERNAFADDPYNQGVLFYNRALVWADLGEYEKAIQDYTTAYETRPNCQVCLHNRSIAYEKLGKLDEAMADMDLMLKMEPDDSDAKVRKEYLNSLLKPKN